MIDTPHPSDLFHLAEAHMARHEFGEAEQLLRQAVALAPDRAHIHSHLGHAITLNHDYWLNPELCQAMVQDGRLDEAIACWRKGMELGMACDWASLGVGHALTAKGDYAEAAVNLATAIDLKIQVDFPEHFAKYGNSGVRKGPDFIIIGGTKCGTTSLYEYMRLHPQVLPAIWKEIEYFRFPERGRDWYISHFPRIPQVSTRFVSGEASTCYMSIWNAKTLVREQFPDARLIALVRDPVDKTISHFHHDRRIGCEFRSYEEALTRELDILEAQKHPFHDAEEYWKTERGYVWLSLYVYMLENWLTAFPKEQLLTIPSEDLYAEPEKTLSTVYAHVGLPDHRLENYEVHLKGNYEKKETDPIRERLKRFFAPHTERLEDLLGRKLDWQRP